MNKTEAQIGGPFRAEPEVRIHLPPADSPSLSRIPLRRSRTPAFRAGVRGWLDGGSAETPRCFDIAPTDGDISVGPYSSTAVPLMGSAGMRPRIPTNSGPSPGLTCGRSLKLDRAQAKPSRVR